MNLFSSLRARLVALVLLAMLPALALTLYGGLQARRTAANAATQDALRLARLVASRQEAVQEGGRQLLAAVASLPTVLINDAAVCGKALAALKPQLPIYQNFGVINLNGEVWCSAIPLQQPVNTLDRYYFQQVLATHDFAVGDYQIGRITGAEAINFAYPVFNRAGAMVGVAYAAYDLHQLQQLSSDLDLPEGATITIRDRTGTVLMRSPEPERWVGESVPEAPIFQIIATVQADGTAEAQGIDGIERLYAFAPVLYNNQPTSYVAVGIPSSVAFADADRIVLTNLSSLAVVTALALLAAWYGSDVLFVRRVKRLLAATRRIGAGDLAARSGVVRGPAEIVELAGAFDQMASALEAREAEGLRAMGELRRWADVFHNIAWGVAIESADGQRLELLNPAYATMHGYTVAELTGAATEMVVAPESRAAFAGRLAQAVKRGHNQLESAHARKDGTTFPALIDVVVVADAENQPLYRVVSVLDITDRKADEEYIKVNARRSAFMAELSGALAAARLDEVLALQTVARMASELLGDMCVIHLADPDSDALRLAALHHPDPRAVEFMRQLISKHPQRTDEGLSKHVYETGETLRVPVMSREQARAKIKPEYIPWIDEFGASSAILAPLKVRDQIIGLIILSRDKPGNPYTEADESMLAEAAERTALALESARLYAAVRHEAQQRQEAEAAVRELNLHLERRVDERTAELAAANQELEAFSYSVSHDLRAPLRSIDGFSQVLVEDFGEVLGEEGQGYLGRVRAAAQRMAALIDDLLSLSRVTRAEMHYEEVDLSAVAQEIAKDLQNETPGRNGTFTICESVHARGDRGLLKVALENLLGNAWKFTGQREAALVEFGCQADNGKAIYYVSDNGAGFDMEYQHKLFGAFQRLHRASEFPGTGIGLATVQRIVRRHGGQVWAKASPGQGATFFFTLNEAGVEKVE